MIILGLIILVAAVVVGTAGVLSNDGGGHELTGGFSVFGFDVTGSTGTLFLCGMVVGAAGLLGLSLLLAGARRTARRRPARRGFTQPRRETAAAGRERGVPTDERGTADTRTRQGTSADEDSPYPAERPRHKQHWFHRRPTPH
ncbi:hypothetical protein ACWD0J_28475 [Streptomyces sp. NPDC003011]